MFVSPTQAIKIYNVSKPTLYSDMKTGKLSFKKDERQKRKINIAELDRLYEKRATQKDNLTSDKVKSKHYLTETNVTTESLKKEIEAIHQNLNNGHQREITLLNNQIEQLQNQIENMNINLNKALDITALLEDKREGQGTLKTSTDTQLEMLEKRLTKMEHQNKELLEKEKKYGKRILGLKKQLEQKNQNWLRRLFA